MKLCNFSLAMFQKLLLQSLIDRLVQTRGVQRGNSFLLLAVAQFLSQKLRESKSESFFYQNDSGRSLT